MFIVPRTRGSIPTSKLSTWTETSSLTRMRSEMDDLFNRFFGDDWSSSSLRSSEQRVNFTPALEVEEKESELMVRAELPGMTVEQIDLSIDENVLTLSGEKKGEVEHNENGRHYSERRYGSFSRSIQLPAEIDPEHVDAKFENGILTVSLKKVEPTRPKKIDIAIEKN